MKPFELAGARPSRYNLDMPHHQILELEPGEQILHEIRRTKIGLVPLIASGVIVFFGVLTAVYLMARFRDSLAESVPVGLAILGVIGLVILVALLLVVMISVYLGNRLQITNERIIDVTKRSLFNQDISQINLNQIQEVTVKQRNILESLFNFGTLVIETAGEQNNFTFKLAKGPHLAAKIVNDAQEEYEKTHAPQN